MLQPDYGRPAALSRRQREEELRTSIDELDSVVDIDFLTSLDNRMK